MKKAIAGIAAVLLKCTGVVILFTGLVLVGAHQFFWGIVMFVVGIISLGLREEGWY